MYEKEAKARTVARHRRTHEDIFFSFMNSKPIHVCTYGDNAAAYFRCIFVFALVVQEDGVGGEARLFFQFFDSLNTTAHPSNGRKFAGKKSLKLRIQFGSSGRKPRSCHTLITRTRRRGKYEYRGGDDGMAK